MNQRHLWTIVTLFLTVLGIPSVGRTQTSKETAVVSSKTPATDVEVVKVGEYQSPSGKKTGDAVITQIYPHIIRGRQAATLFIRNIPVLTFVSSTPISRLQPKIGNIGDYKGVQKYALIASNSQKMGNLGNVVNSVNNDPIHRASLVAAKINQLIDDGIDASQINVTWKAGAKTTLTNSNLGQNQGDDRYIIKFKNQELVEINENTRLADTTKDLSQDALQATNRLRRLIGKASPLNEIAEFPQDHRDGRYQSYLNKLPLVESALTSQAWLLGTAMMVLLVVLLVVKGIIQKD